MVHEKQHNINDLVLLQADEVVMPAGDIFHGDFVILHDRRIAMVIDFWRNGAEPFADVIARLLRFTQSDLGPLVFEFSSDVFHVHVDTIAEPVAYYKRNCGRVVVALPLWE